MAAGQAQDQVTEQPTPPSATYQLWDVRSWSEYTGARSGYSYLDARGRIPTAQWLGDADDSSGLYKRGDGRLQPPTEVLAAWQTQAGWSPMMLDDPATPVVFYCGGGWRSSVTFFYAWLAGRPNLRNYSDGWAGWSTDYQPDSQAYGSTPGYRQVPTGNPVATGIPDDNGNAIILPQRTP
jgi:thiosulfate/3-mercaptopyruvate sulfurtransferase